MKSIFLIALLCLTTSLSAVTIHVPTEQPTIQAGIDAAGNGDTVLVAPGTYSGNGNRDIDTKGKSIVLRSELGPDSTMVNCEGSHADAHRGFHIWRGEDSTTVIEGFQVVGGVAWWPMNEDEYGPTGGGLRCSHSSPRIVNCRFAYCGAYYGGGISCTDSAAPVFSHCEIFQNQAEQMGAGGQIDQGADVRFVGCSFHHNLTESGSALYIERSAARLDSCLLYRNYAVDYTAGVMSIRSDTELRNCTIVDNYADRETALWADERHLAMDNCLIAFNGGAPVMYIANLVDSLVVSCTDMCANGGGDWIGLLGAYLGADGNISADPQFCDPSHHDYHVSTMSPCAPGFSTCGQLIGALVPLCSPAGIEDESLALPQAFCLNQNHPNPFNPATTISFDLPRTEEVTLTIYNLLGQRVGRLLSGQRLAAGRHSIVWDAGSVASGIYLYRIETPTHRASRKMLLIK